MAQSVWGIFRYLGLAITTHSGKIIFINILFSDPEIRFFSWKTFLFFLLYLPLPFYLFGIMTSFNSELYVGIMEEFLEKNNPIDSLTILMFTTVTYINGPLQNVVVASAFPSFPRHKWWKRPRNLTGLAISYLGLVIGSFLLTASFYIGHQTPLPSFSYQRLLGGFLLPFLGFVLSFTHYFSCTFIVCCWLTDFIGTA